MNKIIGLLLVALFISSVSCEFSKKWNQNNNRLLRVEDLGVISCEIDGEWDNIMNNEGQLGDTSEFYNVGMFNGTTVLYDVNKIRIQVNYYRSKIDVNNLGDHADIDFGPYTVDGYRDLQQNCTMVNQEFIPYLIERFKQRFEDDNNNEDENDNDD